MKHPDPKKHRDLSFIKSGLRFAGCFLGLGGSLTLLAVAFLVAECVGVYEELV